ncbi:hypothetical protein ISN44_As03g049730 [Arabidopsis suecica]|uniref:Uncharacterized protein n=1 Tax=Arabidopsis suecica TaxID=45249 RepID=A0A8T2FKU3_ARASU|nr:hypothetical protein ISN44_As03g049730 [Arabidopsis suecica]
MDPTEMRYLEEENGAMMKTFKDAVTGFATGKTSLVFIGAEQLVQNFRAKRDFFNGAHITMTKVARTHY